MKYSKVSRSTLVIVSLALLYFFDPLEAHAYLDPGTGSYVLQIAIAALFAGLFSIKLFWRKIKTYLKNLFTRDEKREGIKA